MARERLSPAQRVSWLRLIRTNNVGPSTFRALVNRFGSAEAAIDALPRLMQRGGAPHALIPTVAEAEDEIAATERLGGRLVAISEPDYPRHLKHIPGPPPLIGLRGGDIVMRERMVGIVGARNASAAGRRMAQILACDLGTQGYVIVSGLARGIDAAAHEAALTGGTIAVLAGGLDRIYPEDNRPLADAILDNGGAWISEMPLGWEPRARDFPRRNRLIAGLSLGVVVVEAAKRSGSLITARLALEQNREVFAVPGSPLDPRAEGGNSLIRQGATLVTCAADILGELTHADPQRFTLLEAETEDEEPVFDWQEPAEDERSRMLNALSVTPIEIDTLIAQTGLAVSVVHLLLLELELAGRIERSSGQRVALLAPR